MKTANDVLEYLDRELDNAYKELERNRFCEEEYAACRIYASALESIIDGISASIEAQKQQPPPLTASTTESSEIATREKYTTAELDEIMASPNVAKILVDEPKKKVTFLDVYVNAFALLLYVTSLFFMSDLVSDILNFINVEGVFYGLLKYGYYLFHTASCYVMVTNADIFIPKEDTTHFDG